MYPCSLMRGNPPSNTLTQLIQIKFSHAPSLAICIYRFSWGRKIEQGESNSDPMSVILPPTIPPSQYCAPPPPHLLLIPLQGKCHFTSPRIAGGTFPLLFLKPFLCELTLFFLRYFHDPSWSLYPLNTVIL